ncbi:glycosyltransferase family 4 protein [Metabacillus herbersteinensis]|uniref:Glycosyltransferase family 4 protein n=1 Tax=Metabacillus herbersteinensis TaxID=283816 RepID=A0ABV6GEX6_9BACI
MLINIMGFLVSYVFCLIITPLISKLALKLNAVDIPDHRKVHVKPMPRLGGLGVYLAFIIGLIVIGFPIMSNIQVILGATLIVILGILDDIYILKPYQKLIIQFVAALVVVYGHVSVDFLYLPFIGTVDLSVSIIPITVLWIIGITNSINLIDGLDGLASGISFIIVFVFVILAIINQQDTILMLSFVLLGSILGFLYHNFFPARIFLGDSGSLFLGFMVSVISLMGLYKTVTVSSLFLPVIILGLPLMDTFLAIFRRLKKHQSVMAPDKEHLHHQLIKFGLSHRKAVLLMYMLSATFGIVAIIFSKAILWGTLLFSLLVIFISHYFYNYNFNKIIHFLNRKYNKT